MRLTLGAIAIALAVAASIGSCRIAADVRSQETADRYGIKMAEQRFAPVIPHLPLSGTIGYISDLAVEDQLGGVVFMAAGYVLAPRLLVPIKDAGEAEWAVGNFTRPSDYAGAGESAGYAVASDLGNGVVLYRKLQR